jgi:actin-like ATPase involved in cell morphogenesis
MYSVFGWFGFRVMVFIDRLYELFVNDIGIDFGMVNILVYVCG